MTESKEQKAVEIRHRLTADNRNSLYEAARFLNHETRTRIGLRVPCKIYVQDPSTADKYGVGQEEVDVRWEPLLGDGPTSARLAVVDYDGDLSRLRPPARWDPIAFDFLNEMGHPVSQENEKDGPHSSQFLQVNAWATAQRVLEFYEGSDVLGRPIPWGFEGNRLLIVPQAGFQSNAFYDRHSKSLKLYYFGDSEKRHYTCLSHDIIAHETGHAILDGIRPYFLEHSSWETAAFHEFVGDMTAIVCAFRNRDIRRFINKTVGVNVDQADVLSGVAEEFGAFVEGLPYLRSARDPINFQEAAQVKSAHRCSQVLSGAMFDLLIEIGKQYLTRKMHEAALNL